MNTHLQKSKYPNFVRHGTPFQVPQPINITNIDTNKNCNKPESSHPTTEHNNGFHSSASRTPPTVMSNQFLDPLLPPNVKLTMQSAESIDGRYILSRLRDHRIYENVRMYLAYLHDKPDSVCIDGKTRTNIMILIQQEGFPTDPIALRQILDRFHENYHISSVQTTNDLSSYGSHLNSKRISYLQRSRNDHKNFFRS